VEKHDASEVDHRLRRGAAADGSNSGSRKWSVTSNTSEAVLASWYSDKMVVFTPILGIWRISVEEQSRESQGSVTAERRGGDALRGQ